MNQTPVGLRLPAACMAVATALALPLCLLAGITDPAYHHLDEIREEIFALQEEFPHWVRVDSVGCSQQERLPIYLVKVSDNVDDTTRVKPSVVINGQVHAEEVLGVEFAMWLLHKMVTNEARIWRSRLNTYILPTTNPEGLRAVFEFDNSYRKNKRDNIGDGRFRYKEGWGGDTSGVDINRNFPTFWIHGDRFLVKGTNEFYDYYRGPAPASEAETRTLMRVMERIRPLYSVTIHSSRTGNVAQKVIYPWGFGQETKLCPDIEAFDELAYQVARRCERYGDPGRTYEPNRSRHPNGNSENHYYYEWGIFGLRIEIGGEGEAMQPDSAHIYEVIEDVAPGIEYVLNSAAGVRSDDDGTIRSSRLEITVTDRETGRPLAARLKLSRISNRMIPYRTTNPRTGVYYWLVNESFLDTLSVGCFGYSPWRNVVFAGADPARIRCRLRPLPRVDVDVRIVEFVGFDEETREPVTELIRTPVELEVEHPDTGWSATVFDGHIPLNLPEGEYRLTFTDGVRLVPRRIDLELYSDTTLTVTLNPAQVLFAETFDDGDVVHTCDNVMNLRGLDSLARWELTDDLYHSPPRCLTDSRRGNTIRLEDTWDAPYNLLDESIDLSSARAAVLTFWLNQALEPEFDSMWVEVSIGGAPGTDPSNWEWVQVSPAYQELAVLNWEQMESFTRRPWDAPPVNLMRFHDWQRMIVPLDDFIGEPVVHFRFHLRTDGYIEEDGVYIDDVYILASTDEPIRLTSAPPVPRLFRVGEPYPNPFNGMFRLPVTLPADGRLSLALFDLNGRRTTAGISAPRRAGFHTFTMDAGPLPSGLYILRVEAAGQARVRKVLLIR